MYKIFIMLFNNFSHNKTDIIESDVKLWEVYYQNIILMLNSFVHNIKYWLCYQLSQTCTCICVYVYMACLIFLWFMEISTLKTEFSSSHSDDLCITSSLVLLLIFVLHPICFCILEFLYWLQHGSRNHFLLSKGIESPLSNSLFQKPIYLTYNNCQDNSELYFVSVTGFGVFNCSCWPYISSELVLHNINILSQ